MPPAAANARRAPARGDGLRVPEDEDGEAREPGAGDGGGPDLRGGEEQARALDERGEAHMRRKRKSAGCMW